MSAVSRAAGEPRARLARALAARRRVVLVWARDESGCPPSHCDDSVRRIVISDPSVSLSSHPGLPESLRRETDMVREKTTRRVGAAPNEGCELRAAIGEGKRRMGEE